MTVTQVIGVCPVTQLVGCRFGPQFRLYWLLCSWTRRFTRPAYWWCPCAWQPHFCQPLGSCCYNVAHHHQRVNRRFEWVNDWMKRKALCGPPTGKVQYKLQARPCGKILMNLFLFPGFSIKAVPFPNAILNVKELGGKEHIPYMCL